MRAGRQMMLDPSNYRILKGMKECIVYSIVHRNDEWHILRGSASEPKGRFKSKTDAIERGRDLAMQEEMATLRVAHIDGSILSETTFGKDPSSMEGKIPVGRFR